MAVFALPAIGYLGAGAVGVATGLATSWLFGSKKGAEQTPSAAEYHSPYETYQPTDARSTSQVYSPSVIYQIESPGAEITKKDTVTAESRASAQPYFWQPSTAPSASASTTEGLDLTKIAIIGAVGIVAYGLVSNK